MTENQNQIDIDFSEFPEGVYPQVGEKITGTIISASLKIPTGENANKDNRLFQAVIAPDEKEVVDEKTGQKKMTSYRFKRQGNEMENMLYQKAFSEWRDFAAGDPPVAKSINDISKSSQLAFRELRRLAKACRYDQTVKSGEQVTVSQAVVKGINNDGVAKIPETFTPPKGISLVKIAQGDWSDVAKMLACFVGKKVTFVAKTTATNDHEVMNIYDPESKEAAAAGMQALNKTDTVMDEDNITPEEQEEIRKELDLNGHADAEEAKGLIDETPFEG